MKEIAFSDIEKNFPKRQKETHKGSYGRLLCVCGSVGMAGAAILSASSAMRCGVGIVNIALPKSIYKIVASQLAEPIFTLLTENKVGTISFDSMDLLSESLKKSTSCLIGCGLGESEDTKKVVYKIIKEYKKPLVIDADGINAVSYNIDILKTAKSEIILTPHIGEMARLMGTSIKDVKENKLKIVKEFSRNYNVILVLKDYETIIALPSGEIFINKTGNPGMATAGSGDILAGMISAFLAQGMPLKESAKCGVYLHALAGDRCANKLSQVSMISSDIIKELPSLFKSLE